MVNTRYAAIPMLSLQRTMGIFFGSSYSDILQFGRFFGSCLTRSSVSQSIGYVSYLVDSVNYGYHSGRCEDEKGANKPSLE